MSADYQAIITHLDENVARTSGHLDTLLDDYERLLTTMQDRSSGGVRHDVSVLVRALESLGAETMEVVVLLHHRGGDHAAAHRGVDRLRRLQEITVRGLAQRDVK